MVCGDGCNFRPLRPQWPDARRRRALPRSRLPPRRPATPCGSSSDSPPTPRSTTSSPSPASPCRGVHAALVRDFCAAYARRLRRRAGPVGDTRHLDELFATIRGQRQYIWRAVDPESVTYELGMNCHLSDQKGPSESGRGDWIRTSDPLRPSRRMTQAGSGQFTADRVFSERSCESFSVRVRCPRDSEWLDSCPVAIALRVSAPPDAAPRCASKRFSAA